MWVVDMEAESIKEARFRAFAEVDSNIHTFKPSDARRISIIYDENGVAEEQKVIK